MRLYHYRSIESALLEIGNGSFHFAAREELNDPLEGFVRVFWQGDRAAWEGLFRNYVCSVNRAIDCYLLQGDENMLHHRTLLPDLHCYDDVPLGAVMKELGDAFLEDEDIRRLAAFYGNHMLEVREAELRLVLHFIHSKALVLCIQKGAACGLFPEEVAANLLKTYERPYEPPFPFELMEKELVDKEHRKRITKFGEDAIEDVRELQYIRHGVKGEAYLYGRNEQEAENTTTEAKQRRNWMTIVVDFPKVYVEQLKEMIYPQSYVVCFSGKNDDSAMWGNYASNHQGVCLIFDTDENGNVPMGMAGYGGKLEAKPVTYGGEAIERNFFETFGRLNRIQIKTWLTGIDSLSQCYEAFNNEEEWREKYWEVNEAKTYRKLKAWEHENEYRIAITDSLSQYTEFKSRNIKFDVRALKGVIFGINTSEYDKMRIMAILLERKNRLNDFAFYQAEYDDEAQSIRIRKKALWKL